MHRLLVFVATGLAALVLSGSAMAWSWPADGDVLRPFTLGGDAYAAGQHRGVDVAGSEGSAVRAPAAGTVTFAGSLPTYGRGVTIATADGYAVTLVHLGSIGVAKGDAVAEGASIGTMGSSGDAEHPVPSVHLGIRVASQAEGYVDPLGLLPPRSIPAPAPPPVQSPAPVAVLGGGDARTCGPAGGTTHDACAAAAAGSSRGSRPARAGSARLAERGGRRRRPWRRRRRPPPRPPRRPTATTAVDATSPGLTVTGAGAVNAGSTASFRVATREGAARVATRTTEPRATGRPPVVDTSTPNRVTSRPADAAVPGGAGAERRSPRRGRSRESRRGRPVPAASRGRRTSARASRSRWRRRRGGSPRSRLRRPSDGPALPRRRRGRRGRRSCRRRRWTIGARPGVLVAAAALLLLAAAAAAMAARRIGGNGALLRHHADLLRQLDAAHRARLHDVAADVFARHQRQRGRDTFLLTGVDEHASKVARVAEEQGLRPQEYADRIVESWRALPARLGVAPTTSSSARATTGTSGSSRSSCSGSRTTAARTSTRTSTRGSTASAARPSRPRPSSSTASAPSTTSSPSGSRSGTGSSGSPRTRSSCSRSTTSAPTSCCPGFGRTRPGASSRAASRTSRSAVRARPGASRSRGIPIRSPTSGRTRSSTT